MKRSRTFALELYPDDSSHMLILDYIKKYFEYAYILHDKDLHENDVIEEKTGILKYRKGDTKKPHYHVLISFKNARTDKSVLEELNQNGKLNLVHIETSNFFAYVRYLIHLGYPSKYQYSINDIETNMSLRVNNALKRDYNSEEQDARILLDFVFKKENEGFLTFRMLTEYALENDCLRELQKKSYFYNQFCDQTGFRRF